VNWLQRITSCHQARAAALGFKNSFMPHSPIAVGPAKIVVARTAEGFEVMIRTDGKDDVLPAAILGRAQDLKKSK
jgi:hypothetical protein